MSRINEIAKILGCTGSNVCYLLRRGKIKGTRTRAGWVVSDEALQKYLEKPKTIQRPIKLKLHKGQKSGTGPSWIQMRGETETDSGRLWSSASVERQKGSL